MESAPTNMKQGRTGLNALIAVVVAVVLVACGSFISRPRQGWNPSYGPVVPHDSFPTDCSLCHTGNNWNTIKPDFTFDHEAKTGVPLKGAHNKVACLLCHNDRGKAGDFAGQGCAGCHEDIHRGQLGRNCSDCHEERSWQPVGMIAKHNRTRFQLVGAHAAAACFRCHPGAEVGNFSGADPSCTSCHQADLARATSPDHAAQGWVNDCQRCHIPISWSPAKFNHPASFPLTGGHAGRDCTSCHQGGVYTGLSTSCNSCHMTDYQATTAPNHVTGGFSTNCTQCHNTVTWFGATFNHPSSFPLTAGHAGRTCASCHTGGVYTGLSTSCNSCHMPQYLATTNPNHTTTGYGTNCNSCHSTATWLDAVFNHPTTFPLTAGHGGRLCSACHQGGVYTGLSPVCNTCHTPQYQASTNPNHTAAGFNTTCNTCHNTTSWPNANYTHISSFPLSGGHAGRTCNACHQSGVYHGLPATCVSCHMPQYQATTNPNHTTAGYSTNCTSCHSTATWLGANVNHPATFPLTAGHAGRTCNSCHTSGVYTGLSTACNTCHLQRYQATTNPNHTAAAFSTTCNTCHNTTSWPSANYTHISSFPLTGGHAGRTCNACHQSGVYHGLPATCVSCHMPKYQATTNPNHTAAGFPTTCNTCHTTTTWLGATFNHAFPIASGRHAFACNQCHLNPANYQTFSCIDCHTHNQATTQGHHNGVNGYQWTTAACYNCHPQGRR